MTKLSNIKRTDSLNNTPVGVLVNVEFLDKLVGYLANKPFREVEGLINGIRQANMVSQWMLDIIRFSTNPTVVGPGTDNKKSLDYLKDIVMEKLADVGGDIPEEVLNDIREAQRAQEVVTEDVARNRRSLNEVAEAITGKQFEIKTPDQIPGRPEIAAE